MRTKTFWAVVVVAILLMFILASAAGVAISAVGDRCVIMTGKCSPDAIATQTETVKILSTIIATYEAGEKQ